MFSGSVSSPSCGDLHGLPNGLESQQSGGLKRKIVAKYPVDKGGLMITHTSCLLSWRENVEILQGTGLRSGVKLLGNRDK